MQAQAQQLRERSLGCTVVRHAHAAPCRLTQGWLLSCAQGLLRFALTCSCPHDGAALPHSCMGPAVPPPTMHYTWQLSRPEALTRINDGIILPLLRGSPRIPAARPLDLGGCRRLGPAAAAALATLAGRHAALSCNQGRMRGIAAVQYTAANLVWHATLQRRQRGMPKLNVLQATAASAPWMAAARPHPHLPRPQAWAAWAGAQGGADRDPAAGAGRAAWARRQGPTPAHAPPVG